MRNPRRPASDPARLLFLVAGLALCLVGAAPVQGDDPPEPTGPSRIPGVRNFGRVTETLYRGGGLRPDMMKSLVSQGVHTIISLRQKDGDGEPEACSRYGIDYHRFAMSTQEAPDSALVDTIFDLIRTAKPAVFIHCSGGQHRVGTLCALYRIRVQGWSPKKAWEEQQAYGFGPPEQHPALFRFVYGDGEALKH